MNQKRHNKKMILNLKKLPLWDKCFWNVLGWFICIFTFGLGLICYSAFWDREEYLNRKRLYKYLKNKRNRIVLFNTCKSVYVMKYYFYIDRYRIIYHELYDSWQLYDDVLSFEDSNFISVSSVYMCLLSKFHCEYIKKILKERINRE